MTGLPTASPVRLWAAFAAADGRDRLCIAAFHVFLIGVFFVGRSEGAKLMIAALAAMALSDATLIRRRLPASFLIALAGLAVLAVVSLLGALANGVPLGAAGEAAANFALVALALIAGRRLIVCWDIRAIALSVLIIASASAVASIIMHFAGGYRLADRLSPLGRAVNPIPGAGGLCVGLIAAALLWRERVAGLLRPGWIAALALPILAAVLLTQSRGPLLAVTVACLALLAPWRWTPARVLALAAGTWACVTALILLDPVIRGLVCRDDQLLCRPSLRQDIWGWVLDSVVRHPLLGVSPGFRFSDTAFNHPHNGVFGIAMFYGLPAFALCLAGVIAHGRRAFAEDDATKRFCAATLVFSCGYMGSDLSNPFAFPNTHYLFLWLPVAFGLARGTGEKVPLAPPESIR